VRLARRPRLVLRLGAAAAVHGWPARRAARSRCAQCAPKRAAGVRCGAGGGQTAQARCRERLLALRLQTARGRALEGGASGGGWRAQAKGVPPLRPPSRSWFMGTHSNAAPPLRVCASVAWRVMPHARASRPRQRAAALAVALGSYADDMCVGRSMRCCVTAQADAARVARQTLGDWHRRDYKCAAAAGRRCERVPA
jgi:hypothetical protein